MIILSVPILGLLSDSDVTNVQNQKLKTTLDQTEDKQLKKFDPLLVIITFSWDLHFGSFSKSQLPMM